MSLGHGDGQCGGGKRHAGVDWVRRDAPTVPNGGAGRRDEQRAKRTIYYSRWAAVACGYDYSVAVKKDDTLWAWGVNYVGQLGLGDTKERHTPTEVGSESP